MKTWTTHTTVDAEPDEVLGLLTEPEAITRWSPIPFELLDLDGRRLTAGTRARVGGGLAGRRLEFDIDVHEAADGRLALRAEGPIDIDVEYVVTPSSADSAAVRSSELRASVTVTGRGLTGRILATATDALLAAGALDTAVRAVKHQLAVGAPV